MNHTEHLVDLIDKNGSVVGSKKRREIDKATDLYHTVFVILCTPDHDLILSMIPSRRDLPNLYTAKIGATVATIRRHKESSDHASLRAIKNELLINDIKLRHLGDGYIDLADRHSTYASIYCGVRPLLEEFSHKDIEQLITYGRDELNRAVQSNEELFAPTFLAIWRKYQDKLFLF